MQHSILRALSINLVDQLDAVCFENRDRVGNKNIYTESYVDVSQRTEKIVILTAI